MASGLKEPVFENVEVGESFGPIELVADEHYMKAHAFAIDDYSSWYFRDEWGNATSLFPSAAIVNDLLCVYHQKYDPNAIAGLHQKEEVWYERAIPMGTRLELTGRYVEKYVKRGKGYVVLEAEARDADGNLYVRQQSTEIMRVPEKVELGSRTGTGTPDSRRVSAVWPKHPAPVTRIEDVSEVKTPVVPMHKMVHQDQMSVYSGAGKFRRNIHTDREFARSFGFPSTLAQGMMEGCYLSEYMGRLFGPGWLTGGSFSIVFLNPVFPGDQLTCRAVVSEISKQSDANRYEVEMWITNADGTMTAAGWAWHTVKEE